MVAWRGHLECPQAKQKAPLSPAALTSGRNRKRPEVARGPRLWAWPPHWRDQGSPTGQEAWTAATQPPSGAPDRGFPALWGQFPESRHQKAPRPRASASLWYAGDPAPGAQRPVPPCAQPIPLWLGSFQNLLPQGLCTCCALRLAYSSSPAPRPSLGLWPVSPAAVLPAPRLLSCGLAMWIASPGVPGWWPPHASLGSVSIGLLLCVHLRLLLQGHQSLA